MKTPNTLSHPFRLCLLFLVLLTLPLLSGCLNQDPQLVCIDVQKVLTDSKAAKEANAHLAQVQDILQRGLAAYQEELKKSPEQQREQELRQGLALLQRQLVIEQAAAREVVQKHMMAQINAWKADKPKVAVIARQNLLAAPATDITADIITLMDAGTVKFAALPKVTITPRQDAGDHKSDTKPQEKKGGKADKK